MIEDREYNLSLRLLQTDRVNYFRIVYWQATTRVRLDTR
jgi:hypothetical protein